MFYKRFLMLTLVLSVFRLNSQSLPQRIDVEWGKVSVNINNKVLCYKDCKVWPEYSTNWSWTLTNTHHVPGVQVADFQEFADSVDIIILTEGFDGVLQIKPETIDYLKSLKLSGKEFYIERTPKAVELYNKLSAEGKRVGILVHSTC